MRQSRPWTTRGNDRPGSTPLSVPSPPSGPPPRHPRSRRRGPPGPAMPACWWIRSSRSSPCTRHCSDGGGIGSRGCHLKRELRPRPPTLRIRGSAAPHDRPARAHAGRVPRHAERDGGGRRAARYRRRPGRRTGHDGLDHRRLQPGRREPAPDRRVPRRPVRPAADAGDGLRPLHRWRAACAARAERVVAARVPGRAGPRRHGADADQPRDRREHLPRPARAREGDRDLGHLLRPRARARADHRRRRRRRVRLAGGVRRERRDRPRGAGRRRPRRAPVAERGRAADRHPAGSCSQSPSWAASPTP